ncbi:venom allergen 5 2-like [Ostrinia furnacalis]|uniref:venom allergen 5 2-like n=1 Tax=Ostrinia furnacalis TaxID=93504 RepID=UPI00103DBAA5|nr:venom allergen 5 2-like [Ostrinia furnacalis]
MVRKILICLLFIYGVNCTCTRVPLTCQQIKHFVDGHNLHRQDAAFGHIPRQPAAANMNALVWDEELAEKAARWAENGLFAHNPDRTVPSKRWEQIGENVFYSTIYSPVGSVVPNLAEAMNGWFSEFMNYNFEPYSLEIAQAVGHYTQMVWAESTKIGCGISQKRENGFVTTLFVCDYGPTGNFIGETPYKASPTRGYLHCGNEDCKRQYGAYC